MLISFNQTKNRKPPAGLWKKNLKIKCRSDVEKTKPTPEIYVNIQCIVVEILSAWSVQSEDVGDERNLLTGNSDFSPVTLKHYKGSAWGLPCKTLCPGYPYAWGLLGGVAMNSTAACLHRGRALPTGNLHCFRKLWDKFTTEKEHVYLLSDHSLSRVLQEVTEARQPSF